MAYLHQKNYNTVRLTAATSSGCKYYYGSKGGSQVTWHEEQPSPEKEEVGLDGRVKQSQNLRQGDRLFVSSVMTKINGELFREAEVH